MKKTAFIALTLLVVLTSACKKRETESAIKEPRVVKLENVVSVAGIDVSVIKMVGNHTYIPLNMAATPAGKVTDILQVLDAFEKSFPHLEVTDWKIEKQQHTYMTHDHIFGLWIDHRPK